MELDRFNLELYATPVLLAGQPFAALGGELSVLLDHLADAARHYAGRPELIGILPTLRPTDFGPGVMTDVQNTSGTGVIAGHFGCPGQ